MQPSFLFKLLLYQSLTNGFPKDVIKQLQRVQNAAARFVTISPNFCHITPVLANLHWLPIDLRVEFKIPIVNYKTLHELAPAYVKDLLQSSGWVVKWLQVLLGKELYYLSSTNRRFSPDPNQVPQRPCELCRSGGFTHELSTFHKFLSN